MKNTHFQRILILPDAGSENPFQYQMIEYLRSHGFEVFSGGKRNLASIYKAVNQCNPKIIYGFFLRKCSKIRVYSESVREEVVKKFSISASSVYVIQDIPYHHYYTNSISKKESRASFNSKETDFIFLFFGKIKKYKGLEELIVAFKTVKKTGDYLFLAGECLDNKYLSYLKKLTKNHPSIIWFDRFVAKEQVQYFFNASNVVVLPFTKIDHSGSIDLAMSFKKPIITLKTGATAELLAHQEILLFKNREELEFSMAQAREINLEEIGLKNFKKADSANFHDLLILFQKV